MPVVSHNAPEPVTTATLLVLDVCTPIWTAGFRTAPPLLTTNWLPAPLRPTNKRLALLHSEPSPVTVAALLVEPAAEPITPKAPNTFAPSLTISWLDEPLPPIRRKPELDKIVEPPLATTTPREPGKLPRT